ncbi:MAG: ABC transporter permease [FCB group bacterium]|jgi:ABC-2 type transport system permease protein|nr:ABC transporter permease [FCB group bacterium]
MFRGLSSIIYKETIHVLRDPRTLFFMILIPGLQLTIFGFAIDLEVRDIKTVVYNLDGRRESRELLDAFQHSDSFEFVGQAFSDHELNEFIVAGEARVGIKIPPNYTDQLIRGERTTVQVLLDGSDSTVAMQALNVANAIAMARSIEILSEVLPGTGGPPIEVRPRVLFNPDMRTVNFMVPGLVGIIMQIVTMLLTAVSIVREKEQGTLEQLMVTPVSRLGLMVGKLVPYGVIGVVETVSVLLIMRLLFGVPIQGSVALLMVFSLAFLFTALGLGLLVSTIAQNQIQALQLSFIIIMPSVLLSGFVFPQETMPWIIWAIGQCIPATYFIRILRGIIIRGAGFEELWLNAAILTGMGVVVLAIATARFRKTLA